jgi:hypothetical protein
MKAAGRVLIGDADRGAAIAVGPRLAVTAHHVIRRRGDEAVVFRTADDLANPVTAIDANEELDVGILHLSVPVDDWLPVASPVPGSAWKADPPPGGNDPLLTGTITTASLSIANARGHQVDVLQLHVEQELGDYHGYSGSGVTDRLGRAVVGLLVEQKHLRTAPALGENPRAANVLYAIPMHAIVEALGLDVAAAPPILLDAPRPPHGMVDRPDLLDLLIESVARRLPDNAPVVRVWGHSGMGKTVLARRLAHDVRVWRAFPGGIVYHDAGRLATAAAVIDYLRRRVETGSKSIGDVLSQAPALLILDDVWDDELVAEVLAHLPPRLTVLVTTIGTTLEAHAIGRAVISHHVAEMTAAESRQLLARGAQLTAEQREALDRLAAVLGRWALLLDMAAAELHDAELRPGDLVTRARAIAAAFAKDPTRLDDPESQRRSFEHMMRRAVGRLTDEDRSRVQRLAIYPPSRGLSPAVLAELWQLDELATGKCVRALRRVGLVYVAVAAAPRLVVHDLIMAWLHREYGEPEDARHLAVHKRLVTLSVTETGAPRALTADRAGWLAYHLRHTGEPDDPMRLLEPPWRAAYRIACGTDAIYLAALREVARHYGARAGEEASAIDAVQDRARAMLAGLLHAGTKAIAANLPLDVLIVDALIGDPDAALLEASSRHDPHEAARAYVEIVRALAKRDRATSAVVEQATTLSQQLPDGDARLSAFLGLADAIGTYSAGRQDIPDLIDRALDTAASLMHATACRALADAAAKGIQADSAVTLRVLTRAASIAEAIAEPVSRARAASAVAAVLSSRQQPTGLWTTAIDAVEPYPNRAVSAIELAAIAEQLFDHDADRATNLFTRAMDKARRVGDGFDRSFACRAVADRLATKLPRDAVTMALEMTPSGARDAALGRVATHLATVDVALAEKALAGIRPTRRSKSLAAVAAAVGGDFLERAVASAAQVGAPAENESARIEVAAQMVERYPDRARDLVDSVINAAASLPSADRDRVLGAAIDVLGRLDVNAAVRAAESIGTASIRDHVRLNLVHLLAGASPLDALPPAGRIATPRLRAQALASIAGSVVTVDPALARDLVADARRSADRIDEPPVWDMGELVRNLAAINLDRAAECVERIDYPGARVRPLTAIARGRFETDPKRARTDFLAAIDIAQADTWTRSRQEALTGIVGAMAECFSDEARRLADEVADGEDVELDKLACAIAVADRRLALRLIDRIEPSRQCNALVSLARTLVAQDAAGARAVFRRAKAVADRAPHERARWWNLATLAVAMRDTNPRAAARMARQLEHAVDNDALRAQLAIAVSRDDARGARSIIERLTDESESGLALSELARVQRETDPAAARATLDEATDTCAATIPRPHGWSRTLVLSSSDERPGRALARAGLAVFDGDPAAALAYFARIPEDRGRSRMPSLMAHVMFPAVHNVTAYTLGGYIDGRASRANVAGPLQDAQSRLADMLQYASGFVIALTSSTHPLAQSIGGQLAETFLRLWPRTDWSAAPSGESVSL